MTDHATPNLPSRDFYASEDFYGSLGFQHRYKDRGWMILERGDLILEFFSYPDLDPLASSFSCCLRLDDVDAFHRLCVEAGVPQSERGQPRITPVRLEHSGLRIGYLVDPDGTLLRLVENR